MPVIATGKFVATAGPQTINTGLTNILALKIFNPITVAGEFGVVAYTTDQLQSDVPGAFLYDGAYQAIGVNIVGGTFTLNHKLFQRVGQTYYWEARGN